MQAQCQQTPLFRLLFNVPSKGQTAPQPASSHCGEVFLTSSLSRPLLSPFRPTAHAAVLGLGRQIVIAPHLYNTGPVWGAGGSVGRHRVAVGKLIGITTYEGFSTLVQAPQACLA